MVNASPHRNSHTFYLVYCFGLCTWRNKSRLLLWLFSDDRMVWNDKRLEMARCEWWRMFSETIRVLWRLSPLPLEDEASVPSTFTRKRYKILNTAAQETDGVIRRTVKCVSSRKSDPVIYNTLNTVTCRAWLFIIPWDCRRTEGFYLVHVALSAEPAATGYLITLLSRGLNWFDCKDRKGHDL